MHCESPQIPFAWWPQRGRRIHGLSGINYELISVFGWLVGPWLVEDSLAHSRLPWLVLGWLVLGWFLVAESGGFEDSLAHPHLPSPETRGINNPCVYFAENHMSSAIFRTGS